MNPTDAIALGFGLAAREARVLAALASLGESTVGEIARVSREKRPTCYVALERLRERGLAEKLPGRETRFRAADPEEAATARAAALAAARRHLAALAASGRATSRGYRVVGYAGARGVARALAHGRAALSRSDTVRGVYGATPSGKVPPSFAENARAFAASGARVRQIQTDDAAGRRFAERARGAIETMTVPLASLSGQASFEIYPTLVKVFPHRLGEATVIESAELARVLASLFDLAWRRER